MDSLWQMVTALVILATSGYVACQSISKIAPFCYNTTACPCCSEPCPADGSGNCFGNCLDGFHGGRCTLNCPFNCIRCQDAQQGGSVSNCTLCKDGYYSTASLYQCQSACSSNCKTCKSSASHCTSCRDGFSLLSSHQCVSCLLGHYFDAATVTCHKCNPLCMSCDSPKTCICSNGCLAGQSVPAITDCRTETNGCLFGCRWNFTSSFEYNNRCDRCIDGNYGINCNLSCPQTCASVGCDRLDGVCFACKVSFFGDYCNMSCPQNCRSECDKTTGQCDSCKNGFYGEECTIECVTNCDSCAIVNGSCIKCADGFFGLICTNHCSENCLNGKCNMDNGSCLCGPGYMGPVCENRITTTSTDDLGPPLVVPATPQNYVGATVGITLTAVVIVVGLVGVGFWCFKKRINGAGRRNFPVFGMTVNMSDIDKLEGQLSRIDKELNKWTSRRAEVASKLEELKANIPYRNTDRADKVEDRSYEMLQKGHSDSPYSSIQ